MCDLFPEYISLSQDGHEAHNRHLLSPLVYANNHCQWHPINSIIWMCSGSSINPQICQDVSESLYKPSTLLPISSAVFSSTQAFSQPNLAFVTLTMFVIESVNFGGNPQPFVIVGGKPGAQVVAPANPLGPEGSIYYLCLPNLGYIVFSDAGPCKGLFILRKNIWLTFVVAPRHRTGS